MLIYFYKIINLINEKFYYGVHKTSNLEDGYMGSGVAIKAAIKKYGIENFKKNILKFFDSEKEAYDYERQIVNEDLIKSGLSYNITLGGFGSFSHIDSKGENNPMFGKNELMKEIQNRPEVKNKKSLATTKLNNYRYASGYINPIKNTHNYWDDPQKSAAAKEKMSQNHIDVNGINNPFFGKHHSTYSLEKMSSAHSNRPRVSCLCCKKEGDISNMSRWHLNNCKYLET